MTSDKPDWKTYSPQSSLAISGAFQLLLSSFEQGDPSLASRAWRSQFLQEGSVVRHKSRDGPHLVLATTPFGYLSWPCEFSDDCGNDATVVLIRMDATRYQTSWQTVLDFDDFVVYFSQLAAPFAQKFKHELAGSPRLALLAEGSPVSILEACADVGFRGIPDHYLDRLMRSLGLSLKIGLGLPKGVLAKVELLIRHFVPGITDEDLKVLMMKRAPGKTNGEEFLGDLLDKARVSDELLEGTDGKEVQKVREDLRYKSSAAREIAEYVDQKARASGSGGAQSSATRKAASSAPRASQAPETAMQPRAVERHEWPAHIAEAKRLLPSAIGCILQPYPKKRSFQVYYPNPVPPRSKCFSYAGPGCAGLDEQECLAGAVRWAWGQHCRETDVECPFEFIGGTT